MGIGGKIFAKGFVLRAKRFIGGGISINVPLCDILVWTCYLNIDLRIHHARISSSFYIRYIELNELRTSQEALWNLGSPEHTHSKNFQPAVTFFVPHFELQSIVAHVWTSELTHLGSDASSATY